MHTPCRTRREGIWYLSHAKFEYRARVVRPLEPMRQLLSAILSSKVRIYYSPMASLLSSLPNLRTNFGKLTGNDRSIAHVKTCSFSRYKRYTSIRKDEFLFYERCFRFDFNFVNTFAKIFSTREQIFNRGT